MKRYFLIGICLVVLLLLIGCAPSPSNQEVLEELEGLSDAELKAVMSEDTKAIAGQAYSPKLSVLKKVVSTFKACTDSDGGLNSGQKGSVVLTLSDDSLSKPFTDYCSGLSVVEYYCSGTGYLKETKACPQTCVDGACVTAAYCGDGVINMANEECDDGNSENDDGCSADCKHEVICGDGVKEDLEQCDGNDFGGNTCVIMDYISGTLACSPTCQIVTSGCSLCGNGVKEDLEQCDGNDFGGNTCVAMGYVSGTLGTLACSPTCQLVTSGCLSSVCGDGIKQGTENCDTNDFGGKNCQTLGYTSGKLVCTPDCQTIVTSGCSLCGNGVKEGTEYCDASDFGGKTCINFGYASGTLACNPTCQVVTSGCSLCGNGIKQGTEYCDGSDFGGKTCINFGYASGTLACNPTCQVVTSGCTSCGNGATQYPEQCDDANTLSGDGCSGSCQVELGWTCTGNLSTCTQQ